MTARNWNYQKQLAKQWTLDKKKSQMNELFSSFYLNVFVPNIPILGEQFLYSLKTENRNDFLCF